MVWLASRGRGRSRAPASIALSRRRRRTRAPVALVRLALVRTRNWQTTSASTSPPPAFTARATASYGRDCASVRTFDTIKELRTALVEFANRYNETWLVARHGYRTPAQVRADQCRLDQNATADLKVGRLNIGSAECLKTGPQYRLADDPPQLNRDTIEHIALLPHGFALLIGQRHPLHRLAFVLRTMVEAGTD